MTPDPGNPLLKVLAALGINRAPQGSAQNPYQMPTQYAVSPRLAALLQSPFVQDTLWKVVGGPPTSVREATLPKNVSAEVWMPTGDMRISPAMLGSDRGYQETVIAHEAAHLMQRAESDKALQERVFSLFPKVPGGQYAATSPREHFAEAFSNGFNVVRAYSDYRDTPKWREKTTAELANDEAYLPGTEEAARWILSQPIYASHPLRAFFAAKDAAAKPRSSK